MVSHNISRNAVIGRSIVAARHDGFGSRMIAFLNARWLSEQLDEPFAFNWQANAFHRALQPFEVFEPSYLEQFHLERDHLAQHCHVGDIDLGSDALRAMLTAPGCGGLVIEACTRTVRLDGHDPDAADLQRVWASIEFVPRLREIMRAARALVPANAVGVHIRRGDIVRGYMRQGLFHDKFLPLAWFKHSVSRFSSEGRPVLLFSDDARTMATFGAGWPVVFAPDLAPAGLLRTDFEQSIFEISALSACCSIVGSRSAFVVLAGLMGAVPVVSAASDLHRDDRLSVVLDDLERHPEDYDALAHAKELQWLAMNSDMGLDATRRDQFLAKAAALDPANETHTQLRVVDRLSKRQFVPAEVLLSRMVDTCFARFGRIETALYAVDWTSAWVFRGTMGALPTDVLQDLPFLLSLHADVIAFGDSKFDRRAAVARAFSLAPDSDLLRARHCELLIDTGEAGTARGLIWDAIVKGRQPAVFQILMARIAVVEGNWPLARGHARVLVQHARADSRVRALVALCLARAGEYENARDWLRTLDVTSTNALGRDWARQAQLLLDAGQAPIAGTSP